ncbi:MAG: pyrimidine-nucleoside phosphorylase [Firmicutes bacterium]|nr:pyrimidine-nucleoside phosphorylase [Bacillota bacterium]
MRACDIIQKKRDGLSLEAEEIRFIVHGFARGEVPDYQMAAFLMAVYFRGMTPEETAALTMAMVDSGDTVDLSALPGRKVDKHSTGGVGDKTSLVLGPMVASAGALVPKMSGRGLGHTGGTLDKLESIPGFRVSLGLDELLSNVRRVGIAIAGQTARLVPADGKMYALRDVTATVDSIPLIASSVMSKKIAGGADAIVLDVKFGSGAFMKTYEGAVSLAEAMVRIGSLVGRETTAVISSMEQPLGVAVGNALEVREAIETLSGHGPLDLLDLCLTLGSLMLVAAGKAQHTAGARRILEDVIASGDALRKFAALVEAQGGDPRVVDDPSILPRAPVITAVESTAAGYVEGIDALAVGRAAMVMGAGRQTKESPVDHAVGIVLLKKVGDPVEAGEPLASCHLRDLPQAGTASSMVRAAFRVSRAKPVPSKLVRAIVTWRGVEPV